MTATDTQNRPARFPDHIEDTCQIARLILVPWMTLSTENDVRRAQAAHSLKRPVLKGLNEDLEAGNQTSQHRADLAWACALTIDSVVDEVNEQSYFKQ